MKELDKSSRNPLNRFSVKFIKGDTLFARLGRAVCEAECIPRKEFFEAWEVARRLRRKMRGGSVLEMAAGHGLISAMMILLDDTSPEATCIDIAQPLSHRKVLTVLEEHWPRLKGRVRYIQQRIQDTEVTPDQLVVSVHACGELTDRVLDKALSARCRLAVLPCCHDLNRCDTGGLTGWMDGPLAVDAARVARLQQAQYDVITTKIPEDITPKNRLLMGWPMAVPER